MPPDTRDNLKPYSMNLKLQEKIKEVTQLDDRHRAYWHDLSKLRQVRHAAANPFTEEELHQYTAYISFWNCKLPTGIDGWAAGMSRTSLPREPSKLHIDKGTFYRISLLTQTEYYDEDAFNWETLKNDIYKLHTIEAQTELHIAWLKTKIVSGFCESPYLRYTSQKYHILLVASLYDNLQRSGSAHIKEIFPRIALVLRGGEDIRPTTIYADERFTLHLDFDITPSEPSAKIGVEPERNFGEVWSNLPLLPDIHREADAILRRIPSWTIALQYLEDYRCIYSS